MDSETQIDTQKFSERDRDGDKQTDREKNTEKGRDVSKSINFIYVYTEIK